ncbi:hypothetical protein D3C71_2032120 [compost metagenome]
MVPRYVFENSDASLAIAPCGSAAADAALRVAMGVGNGRPSFCCTSASIIEQMRLASAVCPLCSSQRGDSNSDLRHHSRKTTGTEAMIMIQRQPSSLSGTMK